MAKIIKITGYLIGDDDLDENEVALVAKSILGGKFDCIEKPFQAQSEEIPDWNDNHPLNYINCPITECEKYFEKSNI